MKRMHRSMMAGAAGASALTLVHQAARAMTPYAPRMDVLGKRALLRAGAEGRGDWQLERQALAGDLLANSAFYSLVGAGGGSAWGKGLALGLVAGLGALFLPNQLGLGQPPNAHRPETQLMTVAWYVIGGLAAASVYAAADRGPKLVKVT